MGTVLGEMQNYLCRWAEVCEELPLAFQQADKAEPLDQLTQIMEGLGYCPRLWESAVALMGLASDDGIGKTELASYGAELQQIFTSLSEAAGNEDYSLVADLVEYDLLPHIYKMQSILNKLQLRYMERIA